MRARGGRVGAGAPVFLAAALEYLCAEILEIAGFICKDQKRKIITPRHIELGCRNDNDFARYFQN